MSPDTRPLEQEVARLVYAVDSLRSATGLLVYGTLPGGDTREQLLERFCALDELLARVRILFPPAGTVEGAPLH